MNLKEMSDQDLAKLIDTAIIEMGRRLNDVDMKIKQHLSTSSGLEEVVLLFIPSDKFVPITEVISETSRCVGESKSVVSSLEKLVKNGTIRKTDKYVRKNN